MQAQQCTQINNRSKIEWTHILLDHYSIIHDIAHKNLSNTEKTLLFWYSIHTNKGMRLNSLGYQLMDTVGYKFVQVDLNKKLTVTAGSLIIMDKYMTLPWFMASNHRISLMDDKLASLLIICDGDLSHALQLNS